MVMVMPLTLDQLGRHTCVRRGCRHSGGRTSPQTPRPCCPASCGAEKKKEEEEQEEEEEEEGEGEDEEWEEEEEHGLELHVPALLLPTGH